MWEAKKNSWDSLLSYASMLAEPMSTGWPEMDRALGGLQRPSFVQVIGDEPLRRDVLSRVSAWAAGDGWRVIHVDGHRGSWPLGLEVVRAGSGDELDASLVERLDLVCLGAEDAQSALRTVGETSPLDLLVVDNWDVTVEELARLTHRRACVVLAGLDRAEGSADMTWLMMSEEAEAPEVAFVDVRQSRSVDPLPVYLSLPPDNRSVDLVRRAGRSNVFRSAASPAGRPVRSLQGWVDH